MATVGSARSPATATPLDAVPNNLPMQPTSFVGRAAERDAVRDLLADFRLVTLTGPGGAGKTRLAWQVAAELADRFPGGVWWVDLAELSDGAAVADAAAAAVGVLVGPRTGALLSLTRYLADRTALMCLDSAEHLLDGVALLADGLFRSGPGVTVVVTSQEPLAIQGEAVWRVPPLAAEEAVMLFRERARLARAEFSLDASNEEAVRSIALQLDGIPLAIELAAAWVRTLTPQEIAGSLDDRFTLLVGGPRRAHRRQRTLGASIDWSYVLLDETDRIVFRRLAVFAGPFGLDGVRAVCAAAPVPVDELLPAVSRLVDKSLVVMEEHGGEARYRMLETIRAFAMARLIESGEQLDLRERHLSWAVEFAETAGAQRVSDPDGWRRAVSQEYPNLRVALDHGLEAGDPDRGRRLAAALGWFWHLDRRGREGIQCLRRAIDRAPDDRSGLQARLLTGLALVADTASPLDLEYDAATRALELATEVGDESLRALCLVLAAVGAFYTDFDMAWELSQEAYLAADVGGNAFVLGGSRALQAIILELRDRHADAERVIDEDLLYRLGLHRGVLSTVLGFLAYGALVAGDTSRALELAEEGLRVAEPLGDYLRVGAAASTLAYVRCHVGDLEGAASAIEPIVQLVKVDTNEVFIPGIGQALGTLAMRRGDPEEAVVWFSRDAQSVDRGAETYLAGRALPGLGMALATLGRRPEAEATLERAVAVCRRLGMPGPLAEALDGQAHLLAAEADTLDRAVELAVAALTERAEHGLSAVVPDSLETLAVLGSLINPGAGHARLLAAAERARLVMGIPRRPDRQERCREAAARLRQAVGDAFDEAWSEGARLGLDEAVAYARRARGTRGRPTTGWSSLTPTELQVVGLVTDGLTNPAIGARLIMSRATVKTHLSHIFRKLDLANRTELARVATRHAESAADKLVDRI